MPDSIALLDEVKAVKKGIDEGAERFDELKKIVEAQTKVAGTHTAEIDDTIKTLAATLDAKEAQLVLMQKQVDALEIAAKRGPKGVVTKPEPEFKDIGENIRAGLQYFGKSLGGHSDELKGKAIAFLERKAATGLNETIGSEGGFLVHEQFAAPILESMMQGGEILSRVDTIEIGPNSNRISVPMIDETSLAAGSLYGGITAYWVSEAATITASKPAFREVILGLLKVAALVAVTGELMQDSTALSSFLSSNVPDVLQYAVEDKFMNGAGATEPLGWVNSGAVKEVAKEDAQPAKTIVYQNVVKMYAAMPAKFRKESVWYINQDILPTLMQMEIAVGTGGIPVYQPANQAAGVPHQTLMGRPVLESEYCATVGTAGDIQYVAPKAYLMARKGGVKADQSPHVYFTQDEDALRFILRVDGQSKWDSTLTPRNGSNTRSPFITLAGRA